MSPNTRGFYFACKSLFSDDEYKEFQAYMLTDPEAGAVIVGTAGCRKVRWSRPGTGKSSGVRAIYYYNEVGRLYMLLIYPKSEKDSLTGAEKNMLRSVVESFKEE
ncbi:addiction module toxin RelE [Cronobacter malonaticus]|nr:addiction module toxin RelE [Cronobacter malonaticus]